MEITLDILVSSTGDSGNYILLLYNITHLYLTNMERRRMTLRGRGKEKDQFEVQQPTVANVLDQLQTRSGRSYQRTPAVKKTKSTPTLYMTKKEELEGRQDLMSQSRTPSTEAVDTEEGVEMTQYIKQKALQKERRTASVKLHRLRKEEYDIP